MRTYEILPFDVSPERADIVSALMRKIAAHETFFSDYEGTCEGGCTERDLMEMCPVCQRRMRLIADILMDPMSRAWEVWRTDTAAELAGFVLFSDIRPGHDALGHYIFFDRRLTDKQAIMDDILGWVFEDHEGWVGLKRVSIQIPRPFHALAKHASRRLGFSGPFVHTLSTRTRGDGSQRRFQLRVEGVREGAITWRGHSSDLLLLGLKKEDFLRRTSLPDSNGSTEKPALRDHGVAEEVRSDDALSDVADPDVGVDVDTPSDSHHSVAEA